jgi:hypothetical protein
VEQAMQASGASKQVEQASNTIYPSKLKKIHYFGFCFEWEYKWFL